NAAGDAPRGTRLGDHRLARARILRGARRGALAPRAQGSFGEARERAVVARVREVAVEAGEDLVRALVDGGLRRDARETARAAQPGSLWCAVQTSAPISTAIHENCTHIRNTGSAAKVE